jgi:hypothetical protein
MLFSSTVESYLQLGGPRAGFLEDGLINVAIERADSPKLKLRETELELHKHLNACREAHLALLVGLFQVLWRPLQNPIASADLRAQGFDDSLEPKISD